jgi:AraC-like DNA-binding protein
MGSGQNLVRAVWSAKGTPEEAVLPGIIVPDSHVEIVFHLGTPWRTRRLGQEAWTLQPRAFAYAQHRRCLQFQGSGSVDVIAFRVSPVVATSVFRCSLEEIWDRQVPLDELIGADAHRLLERLDAAQGSTRFEILDQWLRKRLAEWRAENATAERLFDTLLWRARRTSIADLSKALGPSSRSLRRGFARHVGLGPKEVQLTGRLLTACALLREQADLTITEIADRVGFYDHAALTHAFTDCLGLTPLQFREQPFAFYERERLANPSTP